MTVSGLPASPPAELRDKAAKWLRTTHWDGNGCGTNGTGGCSRCFGPSPADSQEVAEEVLAAVWPDVLARETELRAAIADDLMSNNPMEGSYAPQWHRALRWALNRIDPSREWSVQPIDVDAEAGS